MAIGEMSDEQREVWLAAREQEVERQEAFLREQIERLDSIVSNINTPQIVRVETRGLARAIALAIAQVACAIHQRGSVIEADFDRWVMAQLRIAAGDDGEIGVDELIKDSDVDDLQRPCFGADRFYYGVLARSLEAGFKAHLETLTKPDKDTERLRPTLSVVKPDDEPGGAA